MSARPRTEPLPLSSYRPADPERNYEICQGQRLREELDQFAGLGLDAQAAAHLCADLRRDGDRLAYHAHAMGLVEGLAANTDEIMALRERLEAKTTQLAYAVVVSGTLALVLLLSYLTVLR